MSIIKILVMVIQILISVSYTHLDVYKRQAMLSVPVISIIVCIRILLPDRRGVPVSYTHLLQRKETKEMLDDLTTRDQRMMIGILTMVHLANSKKHLDSDTELLLSIARKHLWQMATLKWQQVDGLNTVLPYGLRRCV